LTLIPKGGSKTQTGRFAPKFEQLAIISKRYEIGCTLLLITIRKLHMGFRLVQKSVTFNDLERRNSPYLALFHRIR